MDQWHEIAERAVGVNHALAILAAIGTMVQMPVHVARIGTMIHRIRTTTLGRVASVATHRLFTSAYLRGAESITTRVVVSRYCPPSGKTLRGLA